MDSDPAELDLHRLEGLLYAVSERGPYLVVAVGILVSVLVVAWLIGRLNGLYVRITGTNRLTPMRSSWPKNMHDDASAGVSQCHGRRGCDDELGPARGAGVDGLVFRVGQRTAAQPGPMSTWRLGRGVASPRQQVS